MGRREYIYTKKKKNKWHTSLLATTGHLAAAAADVAVAEFLHATIPFPRTEAATRAVSDLRIRH
jgi:hypothetical protein